MRLKDEARHASLTPLLRHLIDYAGLFPPAQLDMATTIANFAEGRARPEHWLLNRLIIPVARLEEFESAAASHLPTDGQTIWKLSGLTVPANSDEIPSHVERIDAFNRRHADPSNGSAIIDTIELKATNVGDIDDVLDELPDEIFPFFEIPSDSDPRGLIAALVGSDAGAKIRTGGVSSSFYPSVHELARFLVAAARAGVPFKATAGLHHPFRHYSDAVECEEHGFFNVFLAAAAAYRDELDIPTVERILELRALDDLHVRDDRVEFESITLTTDDIAKARSLLAISFGSCSFDEPIDDLRAMDLL